MQGTFGPGQRIPMKPVTYWAPGALGSDSEISYDAPILIWGRWVEERTTIQNMNGEQIAVKTMVIVDRDVEEGGFLAQGNQTSKTAPPTSLEEAEEIKGFTSMPDLRNLEQIRRAYL